jgi:hypothetical protein
MTLLIFSRVHPLTDLALHLQPALHQVSGLRPQYVELSGVTST